MTPGTRTAKIQYVFPTAPALMSKPRRLVFLSVLHYLCVSTSNSRLKSCYTRPIERPSCRNLLRLNPRRELPADGRKQPPRQSSAFHPSRPGRLDLPKLLGLRQIDKNKANHLSPLAQHSTHLSSLMSKLAIFVCWFAVLFSFYRHYLHARAIRTLLGPLQTPLIFVFPWTGWHCLPELEPKFLSK